MMPCKNVSNENCHEKTREFCFAQGIECLYYGPIVKGHIIKEVAIIKSWLYQLMSWSYIHKYIGSIEAVAHFNTGHPLIKPQPLS